MASAVQAVSDFRSRKSRGLRLRDGVTVRFPAIMGVLNVTPDSFSDGGRFLDPDLAVEHALRMAREGAQIIDIGGESTRPGAAEVPAEDECRRVIPVIRRLARRLDCPISIDTRKAMVAEHALAAGAAIVNDVSALMFDPGLRAVVARHRATVVLMHMRGTPATMQRMTRYRDVVGEVATYLAQRAAAARAGGIAGSRIILDPGIGFAKQTSQNLKLIGALPRLCRLGYPILVGVSRKSFVRQIAGAGDEQLLLGTAAAVALAVAAGASIVRVHDPGPIAAAVRMAAAIGAYCDAGLAGCGKKTYRGPM
ncbi:MAG TPA: dihydropteroate synthase [Candidatus Binataceae bacterium]|nr:dihydropteroate synthase [Candidatus Binataceae bacterium]